MELLLNLRRIFVLLLIHFAATNTTALNILVKCIKAYEMVPKEWLQVHKSNPSPLHDLSVKLISENGSSPSLNISWAINIDGSIYSINATWIELSMQKPESYRCQYDPPFTSKQANYTGLKQLWFHFISPAAHIEPNSDYIVSAYNLPTAPINASGQENVSKAIHIPGCDDERMNNYPTCQRQLNKDHWNISAVRVENRIEVTFKSHSDSNEYGIRLDRGKDVLYYTTVTTGQNIVTVEKLEYSGPCEDLVIWIIPEFEHCEPVCDSERHDVDCKEPNKLKTPELIIVVGCVLAVLSVLFCIWQFCRLCRGRGFSKPGPTDLVGVLLVYPPLDSVFQRAVMALAHFLKSHTGLDVAIDMWQRGSLADQGSVRWLITQINQAHKVLVVLPPRYVASGVSTEGHPDPKSVLSSYTVPASAHEVYSLALNLLMSNTSDLQLHKFCVVYLGQMAEKTTVPVELQSFRAFSLPRDLEKLHYELSSKPGETCWSPGCRFHSLPCQKTSREVREALLHLDRSCLDFKEMTHITCGE
ncbi:interleukin-17 receptor B [Brachyhypopomus gauderio]|uniref:interleukin-17 receptor B n=1 Tax=Brachyhypopomus gauderio TaxID=698409 RepID=UPI00404188FB